MKNLSKIVGIIAMIAIIGFSFMSCDNGNGGNGATIDEKYHGTWVSTNLATEREYVISATSVIETQIESGEVFKYSVIADDGNGNYRIENTSTNDWQSFILSSTEDPTELEINHSIFKQKGT